MGLMVFYLAGQIHDDWREELRQKVREQGLPILFKGPQENHDRSDDIGEKIKGKQPDPVFRDQQPPNSTTSAPVSGWKKQM